MKIDVLLAKIFPAHVHDATFLAFVAVFGIGMSVLGRIRR